MNTLLEAHPAAELFPLLSDSDFESFKADIAARGLIEPIWLCEGKILDGRNRYRACNELGIEGRSREYTGDSPVAFVWSLNGTRRQLSKGQLAAIAVKMVPALKEEAKKRQLEHLKRGDELPVPAPVPERANGEAAAQAAAIVGVSAKTVYNAKTVKRDDPELFKQIESGAITVKKAHQIVTGKHQPRDPNGPKQPREKRAADITRLAGQGYRAEQIADEIGIGVEHIRNIARDEGIVLPDAQIQTRKINAHRVIEETVNGLSGYALGLQMINGALRAIEPSIAKEWASSLAESLKPINLLRKQLLEIANG